MAKIVTTVAQIDTVALFETAIMITIALIALNTIVPNLIVLRISVTDSLTNLQAREYTMFTTKQAVFRGITPKKNRKRPETNSLLNIVNILSMMSVIIVTKLSIRQIMIMMIPRL